MSAHQRILAGSFGFSQPQSLNVSFRSTERQTPISAQQLQNALQRVSDLIEAAHRSLCQEVDYFGNWRSEENREIIASALNISTDRDVS
ncbi:TPA: hypothetical protein MIO61_26175 [Klebsiella pneumoniae subsp. pneumoniae]|nr:hypothetical protein [Klebsiella pneumoniae subsp. pneumoniae]HBY0598046.1 hypothetical protein [Klebsiella pneumoniae subsp. pneumoniae]HBY0603721.1 hypothetical protein [Klebsiella pneumoniae subsp. pneumoniae]HBY0648719.1 hypothetical protein [Klebsiella pneumoniae subsp. pneumoniae]